MNTLFEIEYYKSLTKNQRLFHVSLFILLEI
jgi:hypothetical protein